jgi:TonB family protein
MNANRTPGRLARAGMLLALFLAWASPVHAQNELGPPVVQGSSEVPYPAGAEGNASVLLELVVEKDGSVSQVQVIEGAEPFAEQARRAVLGWRFAPAHRGAAAIRAKTRARVEFRQELIAPAPVAPAAVTPPSAAPPALKEEEAAEDITVRGKRREIGQATISAQDVREMPGAFGDPFRAVEALPGVTPLLSGLPYFFIRGAPPNNNGYFLDGVRVPQLFHVAFGPGVIHPGLVDRVDLHAGAPPASYGRFAGAIIAGQTREPPTTFHGEANLRLVDAGALLEAPFSDGRGTATVAGRYGYPGPIVGAFADIQLGYWDYQTRATWRLGERDRVGVFAFGSHDYLAHKSRTGETVDDFVSDFHRVDLRWDHALKDGHVRVGLTAGYDSQGAAPEDRVPPVYLNDLSAAARLEVEQRLGSTVMARAGADVRIDDYGFEQSAPTDPETQVVPSSANPPPTNVTGGAHADLVWRVAPRVELVPGARVDVYSSMRDQAGGSATVPAFDPRLSARVTLARKVAWLSAAGVAHQYPVLRVGDIPAMWVAGSGFPVGTRTLQTAAQASQGIEIGLPADLVLTTTGFLSGWSGLTDLTAECIQIEPAVMPPPPAGGGGMRFTPPFHCPSNAPVHGRSYGVEFLLRRPLSKRLSGWLAYTLSRSTREARFLTASGGEVLATVPSDYDRTHVLNAVVAYDLGRRWRAGSRFVFYTGVPYSALSGSIAVPPYNDRRDPPFFRLDLRLEKRWPLGKTGSVAFVVEGQNVTLSKETTGLGTDCQGTGGPQGGTTVCTRATIGPITIPSIGVEAFF